jgi:ketosteroid isomerase-like protein
MSKTHAAISGRDLPARVETPAEALREYYHGFNHRDMTVVARNWLDSADVSLCDPASGMKRGWQAVAAEYERVFAGPSRVTIELHDYSVQEAGDVFWAVGRERGSFHLGDVRLDLAIHRTRVFRRVDGRWRQVHDHGSIEIPELLARYQRVLLANDAASEQ